MCFSFRISLYNCRAQASQPTLQPSVRQHLPCCPGDLWLPDSANNSDYMARWRPLHRLAQTSSSPASLLRLLRLRRLMRPMHDDVISGIAAAIIPSSGTFGTLDRGLHPGRQALCQRQRAWRPQRNSSQRVFGMRYDTPGHDILRCTPLRGTSCPTPSAHIPS